MWPVIVAFLVFVVVLTLLLYVANRWVSGYLQRHIGGRLEAIDQIVNQEQVPDAWLRPYCSRAEKLRASGAGHEKVAKLTHLARKRCLMNIQELIRYVEDVGLTDDEATKRYMLEELRKQEASWQDDATWRELVEAW